VAEHTLPRSGQAPLTFTGQQLAESDGERQSGKEHNRWHELAVWRTTGGKYVVQIAYRTKWQGELDHDAAVIVDQAKDVISVLTGHDPVAHVGGYPIGAAYAERQSRLLADIRARYDSQVSAILESAPEFAERVE